MKAITVDAPGGPEVLVLTERDVPVPGSGEVVVKLHSIGVNPVETYIRAGIYGPISPGYTPGNDGAGIVEAVGADVSRFVPGDRVYVAGSVSGTYAEFSLSKQERVWKLPANMSFDEGAAIGVPYATAWRALFIKGNAKAGQTVLIHGASGGVGTAAVQLAKVAGLVVVGTAGTAAGMAQVLDQGADFALNHREAGYLENAVTEGLSGPGVSTKDLADDSPAHILKPGVGFDLILEMLANANLDKDLDAAAKNGTIVVIGNRGRTEIDARKIMAKELTVTGMVLFNAPESEYCDIHTKLGEGFANGMYRPIIGKSFSLTDAAAAHIAVMEPGAQGKIVLHP